MTSEPKTAVLIVSSSYSECSNCGKQTLIAPATHAKVSGYDGGGPGCGATFTAITTYQTSLKEDSDYDKYWRAILTHDRPDLPIVPYGSLAKEED